MKFYVSLFYRLWLSKRAQKSISANYLVKHLRNPVKNLLRVISLDTNPPYWNYRRWYVTHQTIERKEHGAVCGAELRYSVRTGGFHVFFSRWPQIMSDLGKKTENGKLLASKHSKLCERHFTPDSFIIEPSKARSIGYTRLQLKKDATPNIFDNTPISVKGQKRKTSEASSCLPKQCRSSKALEKRRALDVKS